MKTGFGGESNYGDIGAVRWIIGWEDWVWRAQLFNEQVYIGLLKKFAKTRRQTRD